jgi:subtilisin family serine protease
MCNTGAQWSEFNNLVYVDEVNENGDTVTNSYPGLEFYATPSDHSSIGSYAVHDSVISAGGYVGRNKYYSYHYGTLVTKNVYVGERYNYSSYQAPGYGPTGRHLQTVTAPSYDVVAACSRYSDYMTTANSMLVAVTPGWNGWGVMTGTSMAAPTVAGIIAEWLQINPNMSPSDVKNVIAQTAKKDYYTQEQYSGYKFGPNGKIDAMGGAQYILSQMQDDILLGDVTGDGLITVMDVSTLISYLLYEDTEINFVNSDINEDGVITINDVSLLVSLLLSE